MVPGRRLSSDEQRLKEFWDNPPQAFARPLLKQLRLEAPNGLRGIHRLVVPFSFPITVICGRNGVGKSTVLALTALSSRPTAGWRVYWGNARPRTQPNARAEYSFSDFFHRRRGEAPLDGIAVTWVSMDRGNEIEVSVRCVEGRWTRIRDAGRHRGRAAAPVRAIDFVPVARVLPAIESGALRSAFLRNQRVTTETLSAASVADLSFIMGKQYQLAETDFVRGLGLARCQARARYSGFDMGSGESSVIVLLSRLQAAEVGGLIVIEEIELGLHAEAQARLAQVLMKHCIAKRLQIVCTTHSEAILDAVPRCARVLLRKNGDEHEAIQGVSTRFALHEMAGAPREELILYTEDRFAAAIVDQALAGPDRARIRICDVGSNSTLARQAVAHIRSGVALRALSVFDGDCTEAGVNSWIASERGERRIFPDYVILPADGLTPEAWIIRELTAPAYLSAFAQELNCSEAIAQAHVEAMRVQLNLHGCAFTLSQRAGLDESSAQQTIIRSVARRHPGLDALRTRVRDLLAGAIAPRPI